MIKKGTYFSFLLSIAVLGVGINQDIRGGTLDPEVNCNLLDPQRGPTDGTVSIHGSGFAGYSTDVTFSGLPGSILALTDSRIDVATPAGLSAGPVVVTVGYYEGPVPTEEVIFGDGFETPMATSFKQADCGEFRLNRSPVLGALDSAIVNVGQTFNFTVSGSDPDNDPLELFVGPSPLPANTSFNLASGAFKFSPEPLQVGEFDLTFSVSDGQLSDQHTITITIPPLQDKTSLQGYVLTLNEAPLEGVRLVWGVEDPVEAFTQTDGSFLLDNLPVGGRQRLLIDGSTVPSAPQGTYATVPEQINAYEGAVNIMHHAIHLLPLDVASADVIDPNAMSQLISSDIEYDGQMFDPITISVEAGSAEDETGNLFDGSVHISNISDATLGPLPLPDDIEMGLYFAIQPFGVHYEVPAKIEVPNIEGFAVGTVVDFIALNHDTGFMEKIGDGIVDSDDMIRSGTLEADGSFVYHGIVTDNSWHGFVPAPPKAGGDDSSGGDGGGCGGGKASGSEACEQTGNLTVSHKLVTYTSMDTVWELNLNYHSQHASPHPFMGRFWSPGNLSPGPQYMSTTIALGGLQIGDELFYQDPDCIGISCPSGRFSRVIDAKEFPTSVYPGVLTLSCQFIASRRDGKYFENIQVINEINSPFGAGWSLMGLERIYPTQTGQLLLVDGSKKGKIYSPAKRARAAISAPGQRDIYRVSLNAGDVLSAQIMRLVNQPDGTSSLDPVIELHSSNGYLLASDDNTGIDLVAGPNSNAAINGFSVPATDTYTIVVRAALGTMGTYDLLLTTADSAAIAAGKINPAAQVAPAFNFDDEILVADTSNNHVFAATAGTEISIYANRLVNQPDNSGSLNPSIKVYDSGNVLMFSDDDSGSDAPPGPGWNALLVKQVLPFSDDFRIEVSGAGSTIGSYNVEVVFGDLIGNASVENDAVELSDVVLTPLGEFSDITMGDNGYTKTDKFGNLSVYDMEGRLTDEIDLNNNTTQYHYDGSDRLSLIRDPVGLETVFSYNDSGAEGTCKGKLDEITDPAGRVTRFAHNNVCDLLSITNPDGATRIFAYDNEHLLTSQVSARGTETVEPDDFKTQYTYDFSGRFLSSVLPDGSSISQVSIQSVGLLEPPVNCNSNPQPGCLNMLAPTPGKAAMVVSYIDANSNESVSAGFDAVGNPSDVTDALGNQSTVELNVHSLPISETNRRGFTTTYTYDDRGNETSRTQVEIGATELRTYHPVFGTVISITDPNGNLSTLEYDTNGNAILFTDAAGNLVANSYNDQGQLKTQGNKLGDDIEYVYDATTSNLIQTIDQSLNDEIFTYDAAGNMLSTANGEGMVTLFKYDDMNRVVERTDALGEIARFSYDIDGNLTRITDERGNSTVYEYDVRNRRVKMTDTEGRVATTTYDNNGNATSNLDQNGQLISFEYDELDRLTRKVLPDGNQFDYLYDGEGNLISASDDDSLVEFTYDERGQLVQERQVNSVVTGADSTISYIYDLNGFRESMTSDAGTTGYEYNNLNRLTKITTAEGSQVHFEFDAEGKLIAMDMPNGITTETVFDKASRILSISHQKGVNTLSDFDYIHDKNGNKTNMDVVRPGLPVGAALSYAYDDIEQLVSSTAALLADPPESFSYDETGNRIRRDGELQDATYDLFNTLEQNEQFVFSHDSNGNQTEKTDLISGEVIRFSYDPENRLTGITHHTNSVDAAFSTVVYSYDGLGRRIAKNVNGIVSAFVYDGDSIIIEHDDNLLITAAYTHDEDFLLPLIMFRGGVEYSYQTDALGNVVSLADESGALAQNYVYDSFGRITVLDEFNSAVSPELGIQNPFTFTAKEYDPESGMFFFLARIYDQQQGRFINPDPIFFAGDDLNLYRYVGNNPLNLIDPDGKNFYSKEAKAARKERMNDNRRRAYARKQCLTKPKKSKNADYNRHKKSAINVLRKILGGGRSNRSNRRRTTSQGVRG